MLLIEFFNQSKNSVNEMAERMSDIINARELIGSALADSRKKQEYFKFLEFLRNRYGNEYSTHIHQEASKLAKKKEAVDG